MLKTIKQWYLDLPEPVRTQALKNVEDAKRSGEPADDLPDALISGFHWYSSPEGGKYWDNIYFQINTALN